MQLDADLLTCSIRRRPPGDARIRRQLSSWNAWDEDRWDVADVRALRDAIGEARDDHLGSGAALADLDLPVVAAEVDGDQRHADKRRRADRRDRNELIPSTEDPCRVAALNLWPGRGGRIDLRDLRGTQARQPAGRPRVGPK